MNCPRCNNPIQTGNSFCSSCGFNLNEQNNVNNNNFGNQQNMNSNNQQMYNNNMMNNQNGMMNNQNGMMNNQNGMTNNQNTMMNNQNQQIPKGKRSGTKFFKMMIIFNIIGAPLLLLQIIGGGFQWDTFSTFLTFDLIAVSLYMKEKRENMNNKQ